MAHAMSAPTQLERYLPPLLSVIAGMVDVIGFLTLGNIFTAHLTGNLVVVAAAAVRPGHLNPAQVAAIPVAALTLAALWLLARASGRRGVELAPLLLTMQAALLIAVLAMSVLTDPAVHPHGLLAGITAMIAVAAMACQYAVFRLALPRTLSTAVMTGNFTNAVLALMDRRAAQPLMARDDARLGESVSLLVGFLVGCVIAAAAIPVLGTWVWSLPVVLALTALSLTTRKG